MSSLLFAASVLALVVIASGAEASGSGRTILYDRAACPSSWRRKDPASPKQRMHFTIGVKQQNLDKLEEEFWAVASPDSPKYQEYRSHDDIEAIVSSKSEHMDVVLEWLGGLSTDAVVDRTADAIDVHATVQDVQSLFEAKLYEFVHENGHKILRAWGPYSVPTSVESAIDLVEGIAGFPMRPSARKTPDGHHGRRPGGGQVPLVIPDSLLKMYSVPANATRVHASQAVVEFQDHGSYDKNDVAKFFKQTGQPQESIKDVVGPLNGTYPDTEAALDVQYITAIGRKRVNMYWTSDNWMYQLSRDLFKSKHIPDAVSISWGWAEDGQCFAGHAECNTLGIDPARYEKRVDTEFQKIGLRGVSLFAASGDSGANAGADGKPRATWPGSSPYVTSVGATQLQDPVYLKNPPAACNSQGSSCACASNGFEVAASANQAGFTSGGGFSTYTPMPDYQRAVANSYLQKQASTLPPSSGYNRSNRAFPDVAALGSNFLIYIESLGGWSTVGGTGASSVTFAGISARLNDISYQQTGKPLGFLNPLLYKMYTDMPGAFNDITVGDNQCSEDGRCPGYKAAAGWDPVTGLGTPNVKKMLPYVANLLRRRV